MPDPFLMTKVSMPLLRHSLVPRTKVLKQISDGIQDGHLLTLVSAPAGYGKTTAIRLWAEEAGCPVAWVTLENSDNNLKQFLAYMLIALQQAGELLGQAALEMTENSQDIELNQTLRLLINDLYELEQPIILVLEDYHLIENEKIDQAIELLLNQAVANLHLVIATREDPNLPLTRLRVRNQLTEVRAADLSFSIEEVEDFFSNVMNVNISKKETEILKNKTEGWAAGLQLAALSLKQNQDHEKFVEAFRGTHRHVLDYLMEEVLKNQPEEVQIFLHSTAILDQLSPSLCQAVTGQDASRKLLHYLDTNNLFLISLDEERTWYRYHSLFAELLRNQLLQADHIDVDNLHERAADWYRINGFIHKAVEHSFQLSNSSKVAGLIEEHALPMIYQGEVLTVLAWFDRLPESLMQFSPMLCICKAWSLALIQRQSMRTGEVDQALLAAEEALNRTNADGAMRNLIAGYAASIQAFAASKKDSPQENPKFFLETAQKAQKLLPEDEKAIRSVNSMIIANEYTALADLPAAEMAFKQTFEDGVAGKNYYAAIYGPINLILIAMMKGQRRDALRLCETNIAHFNHLLAGQRFPPIGGLHILKGCLLLEENKLLEAEQELIQGLSLIRWTGEYRTHLKGFSAMARLHFVQRNRAGMIESLNLMKEIRPEAAAYSNALLHRYSVSDAAATKSDFDDAQAWLTDSQIQFENLPDISGMDPIGEVTFRTYLSAAHILTSLAARNPRAHSLLEVHHYFDRQQKFAEAHNLVGWLIEIWILRALMYQVEGKHDDSSQMMRAALRAAEPQGYSRIFLDESDLICTSLGKVQSNLKENNLFVYAGRLQEAIPGDSWGCKLDLGCDLELSEREIDVLGLLASGLSYKDIGKGLFLSLNTVQFHVKNIYRKLSVNRRVQAIERARELKVI